jgi:hypothetical protein
VVILVLGQQSGVLRGVAEVAFAIPPHQLVPDRVHHPGSFLVLGFLVLGFLRF